ncbi:unnamed protein product [Amoebophrya sp. A25]|nr:unnamed protein product [Amoebophrya sp. A25]|eukprot:GSA25T00027377001.1
MVQQITTLLATFYYWSLGGRMRATGLSVEWFLGLAYLLTWLAGTMYASAAYFIQREIMPGQEAKFLEQLVIMQTVAGILCKSGVGTLLDGPLDLDSLVRRRSLGSRFLGVHCGALFLGIAPGSLVIASTQSAVVFLAGVFLVEFGLSCAWPVFTRAVAEYSEIRKQASHLPGIGQGQTPEEENKATRLFWVLGVASRCGATLAGIFCAALADCFSRRLWLARSEIREAGTSNQAPPHLWRATLVAAAIVAVLAGAFSFSFVSAVRSSKMYRELREQLDSLGERARDGSSASPVPQSTEGARATSSQMPLLDHIDVCEPSSRSATCGSRAENLGAGFPPTAPTPEATADRAAPSGACTLLAEASTFFKASVAAGEQGPSGSGNEIAVGQHDSKPYRSKVKKLARDWKVWRVAASVTLLTCVKMYCQGMLLPAYLDNQRGSGAAVGAKPQTTRTSSSSITTSASTAFFLSSVFTFGVTLGVLVGGWCFSNSSAAGQVRLLRYTSIFSTMALLLLVLHAKVFPHPKTLDLSEVTLREDLGIDKSQQDNQQKGNAVADSSTGAPASVEVESSSTSSATPIPVLEDSPLSHLVHNQVRGDESSSRAEAYNKDGRTEGPSLSLAGNGGVHDHRDGTLLEKVGMVGSDVHAPGDAHRPGSHTFAEAERPSEDPTLEHGEPLSRRFPALEHYSSASESKQLIIAASASFCFVCAGVGLGLAFYQPPGIFAVQYGRDASSTLSAFTDGVAMLGTLFLTPCCAAVQSRLGFVALFGLLASLLSVGTLLSVQYYRDLAEQVVVDGATDEKVSEAGHEHDAALIQREPNATGTARL